MNPKLRRLSRKFHLVVVTTFRFLLKICDLDTRKYLEETGSNMHFYMERGKFAI